MTKEIVVGRQQELERLALRPTRLRPSLALLLVLVFAACSGGSDAEEDQESRATALTPAATRATRTGPVPSGGAVGPGPLLRDFVLPLPLFAPDSAWNQKVTDVPALPDSEERILALYRVLLGDDSTVEPEGIFPDPYPFVWLSFEDWTVPIFGAGGEQQTVLICDYEGELGWTNPKLPAGLDWDSGGGRVTVPAPAGAVRPSVPTGTESDGHLVLYDAETFTEYDYWQATTVRDGECGSRGGGLPGTAILEAGMVDFFDVRGPGANPRGYFSARASGVPLLAGLIVPEDIERGAIEHALVFTVPGVRSVRGAVEDPDPRDIIYPASQIEPDFYNTDPRSLAHGQRIRLKEAIVDADGEPIDEGELAPITRMFLEALRTYGAYLVDNAGGFVFSAEDIHTANLRLSDAQVNGLIGLPPETPLPEGKTRWQIVMEKLLGELFELPGHEDGLPLASNGLQPWWAYESDEHDPATATFGVSNFEVIEPATLAGTEPPSVQSDGDRSDGAELVYRPDGEDSAQNPAFSPDGETMLFTVFHGGYNGGPAGLYLLAGDGDPVVLLDERGQDSVNLPGTSWSAASGRIAFASDREDTDEVWTVAADGSGLLRVTHHDGADHYIEPSFSPGGEWIVFEASRDLSEDDQQGSIWKVRSDGTSLTRLTDGREGADDREPNWSPAGDRILIQRRLPGSDDWDLYTMAPDGSDTRRVFASPSSDTDASWSPDGAWIVFSSDYGALPAANIFVVAADGGVPIRVTRSEAHYDGAPSWSPDGRWIVFESVPLEQEETPASLWRIAAPVLPDFR